MMTQALVKSFESTPVEFLRDETGEIWITGEMLGKALGYSEPGKAIRKLHERHKSLLEQFSVILTRKSKGRPARAFNETGCNIIAMKAETERANQFVIWAANILKAYRHGELGETGELKEELKKLSQRVSNIEAMSLPGFYDIKNQITEEVVKNIRSAHVLIWLNTQFGFNFTPQEIILKRLEELNITYEEFDGDCRLLYDHSFEEVLTLTNNGDIQLRNCLLELLKMTDYGIWESTISKKPSEIKPATSFARTEKLLSKASLMADSNGLLSIKNCMDIFNVSNTTLYDWIKNGLLVSTPGYRIRKKITIESVMERIHQLEI